MRTVNINPEINPLSPFQAEAHTEDTQLEIDLKFEAIEMKRRENTDTSKKEESSQNLEKRCIIFSVYQGLANFSIKGEDKKYLSSVDSSASVTYLFCVHSTSDFKSMKTILSSVGSKQEQDLGQAGPTGSTVLSHEPWSNAHHRRGALCVEKSK